MRGREQLADLDHRACHVQVLGRRDKRLPDDHGRIEVRPHGFVAGQVAATLGPLNAAGAYTPAVQVLIGGADQLQCLRLGLAHECASF